MSDAGPSDGVQIVHIVGYILNLQDVEVEAKLYKVFLGFRREFLGELEAVFIDLFWGQAGQNTSQVTLQGFLSNPLDLKRVPTHEAFDCVLYSGWIARHLNVRHSVHIERNPSRRVCIGCVDLDGDGRELHAVDFFDDGPTPRPSTAKHLAVAHAASIGERPTPAGEHQHLIGLANKQELFE